MNTSAPAQDDSVEIKNLEEKVANSSIPSDLRQKANSLISRASLGFKYGGYLPDLIR